MAARQIIVPGAMPSRDANGRALPAKLRFYEPDTAMTTVATVYTDMGMATAHAFPILSDSAGRWPQIWAEETTYFDVAWSDQVFDRTIDTFEDIRPLSDATIASVQLAQDAQAAAELAEAGAEAAEAAAEADAAAAAASALQAEASASSISGAPFSATSTTPLLVSAALKTFVLDQTGKLFTAGQTVVIARMPPNASTQMTGVIQTHDPDTGDMTVLAATFAGSGTHSDWSISLSSSGGVLSIAGETGVVTAVEARTAIDLYSTSEVEDLAAAFAIAL